MRTLLLILALLIPPVYADQVVFIITPHPTDFENLPKPIQDDLNALGWVKMGTDDRMPGTRVYQGKKITAGKINDTPLAVLESKILSHGLNWTIVGKCEAWAQEYDQEGNPTGPKHEKKIAKASVIDYFNDVPTAWDANGVPTAWGRPTTISLPVFLGHQQCPQE